MFMNCLLYIHSHTLETYSLSLHDALPIYKSFAGRDPQCKQCGSSGKRHGDPAFKESKKHGRRDPGNLGKGKEGDRKSTRLNSSHVSISYAVFCLKKKR